MVAHGIEAKQGILPHGTVPNQNSRVIEFLGKKVL